MVRHGKPLDGLGRLTRTAALVSGLSLLTAGSAMAQPAKAQPPPPAAPQPPAQPAQPAQPPGKGPAQPPGKGPAQPAKGPKEKPAKPLTPKQKEEAAGKAFAEGRTKMTSGDFQGAYEAFKIADEMVPDPPVPKFKMAEALDKANDVEGAITAYENFLAAKPRAVEDKERIDAANARLVALKAWPADVKVTINPPEAAGATLMVDGAAVSGNPLKIAPGKHAITAKLDGFEDSSVDVEVTRNEKKEITITLTAKPAVVPVPVEPTPPPPQPDKPKLPPEPTSTTSIIPAIVTLSLAGAGVVVGGVFGGLALKSKGEYEDTPTQDLFDETERNALIADMSFGVALTFGVTGVVLLLTSGSNPESAPAPDKKAWFIVPFASPEAAGAVGQVTF